MRLVGLRKQAPTRVAQAADKRARAFTVFVNCYDEIRRAVMFVRWHANDADRIAPSLYAGRKRHSADTANLQAPPAPAWPAPAIGTTPVDNGLDNLPGGSPFA